MSTNYPRELWSENFDEGVESHPLSVTVAELATQKVVRIPHGIRYLEVLDDGGGPFKVYRDGGSSNGLSARTSDMIPVWPGNILRFGEGAAAPSRQVELVGWTKQDGTVRAMSRGTVRVVGGNGKSTTPTGHNTPTRIALAAAAASHALSADAAYAIVRAGGSNAAAAYISNSNGAVAVATTRWEKLQAEGITVYEAFSHLGTAGDFLYVWEYKS